MEKKVVSKGLTKMKEHTEQQVEVTVKIRRREE